MIRNRRTRVIVRQRAPAVETSSDAIMDDVGARDTLASLLDDCIAKSDIKSPEDHPFTVFYVFKVPVSRMAQFEAWAQQTIVSQSQMIQPGGYGGTLIYRPDSFPGNGTADDNTKTYVLDARYRGASNIKKWLMSRERALLYNQADRQGIWVKEATRLRVVEGTYGSLDNIWQDSRTKTAHKETSFAKWRVVLFKSICVWFAVMVMNWPGCSMGSLLKAMGWSKLLTHTVTVNIAVAIVVFVTIPFFQPYFAPLLVRRSQGHPDLAPRKVEYSMTETMDEHISAAAGEASELLQAAEDESLGLTASSDGIITMILNYNVKPGCFDAFEEAFQDLNDAALRFNPENFVGETLVRPPPNSNSFTTILRYRSKDALQKWLASEDRGVLTARLYKLVQSPAEVKVQNYSAVELLFSGYAHGEGSEQLPPPRWKTFLLICFTLYGFSLISLYVIAPFLNSLGSPYFFTSLVTSIFNCGSHSYTVTPVLSGILAPWLQHQTPHPSWMSPDNPFYRLAMKGFTTAELNNLVVFYFAWVLGRWRPTGLA